MRDKKEREEREARMKQEEAARAAWTQQRQARAEEERMRKYTAEQQEQARMKAVWEDKIRRETAFAEELKKAEEEKASRRAQAARETGTAGVQRSDSIPFILPQTDDPELFYTLKGWDLFEATVIMVRWAKNLGAGSTTEITLSRALHLTNISISSEFRNAFAPTSLMISMVLGEQTSPFYTIATLIVGGSSTLQVNVRLDQGVKYVLKVNGPNLLSILGYHPEGVDGSTNSFRTFARPGFTNRNAYAGATRSPSARTGPGANAAPDIVISSAGPSDVPATGAPPPGRTLSAPSTSSENTKSQNEKASIATSSSDQQPAQFNPTASTTMPAAQSNFLSATNARGSTLEFSSGHAYPTVHTPQHIPLHHGYISQPIAASTGVDHASKKVKGEDGTPRRQSSAEGPGNAGGMGEITVGLGNNKRKMDFDHNSTDSSSLNTHLVPSATYSRKYISLPPVAGISSNHASPATYTTMHAFSHAATASHSNTPSIFQNPSTPSAAADGPRSSM
ncbi:hypothetical protein GG344DRAFT_68750 [Lentinula edodes]|nr:hypothetical protein GG344DRAFT_68750 [Lentinula edodes]